MFLAEYKRLQTRKVREIMERLTRRTKPTKLTKSPKHAVSRNGFCLLFYHKHFEIALMFWDEIAYEAHRQVTFYVLISCQTSDDLPKLLCKIGIATLFIR